MFGKLKYLFFALCLLGVLAAQSGGTTGSGIVVDYSTPSQTTCSNTGNITDFTCQMMEALLGLGPMIAIIALVLGGIIYVYANVFVTADQRGRYHSLAMNLAIGAIILAAIVGGAGVITQASQKFIQA